jgi:hypothetical protein
MKTNAPKKMDVCLPVDLEQQLYNYRNSVWISKTTDAVALAVCVVLLAFLSIFLLDRFLDTPSVFRFAALMLAALGSIAIPVGIYRWVWRRRNLPQVARLIARQMPDAGDRLLGVLELVGNPAEQQRSPELCYAAVQQVAADAKQWDLTRAAQPSRRRGWWIQSLVLLALAGGLAVFVPAAAQSSWARLLSPWKPIPRYSFAMLTEVPQSLVVPHGEPFLLELTLADESPWKPAGGQVTVGSQQPLESLLKESRYRFEIPGQIHLASVSVRIGDARHTIALRPTLRPELTSVLAQLTLPEYLQRPDELEQDVRGGSIALVNGSRMRICVTANRALDSAQVNGMAREPVLTEILSPKILIEDSQEVIFQWTDTFGLEGKQPFKVMITQTDDEPPAISCQGLSRQQVVLVTEQLRFDVQVRDDFGIREIGMEWSGFDFDGSPSEFHGERTLTAGGVEREVVNASGTFTADALGIDPQPISLRIYAEDYLPGRERSYSPPYVLYVLSPDQHAIWLTEQLSKWHRRALEVRDRELQLYETNKQLRALPVEQLQLDETRKRVEQQAAAERANGYRLSQLAVAGEQLVLQATKNPEFGVGHLEKWAEMLQLLKDISANRMPSVAGLLKEASQAPQLAAKSQASPTAGVDRPSPSASADNPSPDEKEKQPVVPQIVDSESSQQSLDPLSEDSGPSTKKRAGSPRLTLPVTTLMGKASPGKDCPVGEKMDDALTEQRDLLTEFERIANELNNILANLEGSSLVKRLKAASRKQYSSAGEIGALMDSAFGRASVLAEGDRQALVRISGQEEASSQTVSYILDDMQAYFQRRPFARFRTVIDEMVEADVVGNLRELSVAIPEDHGLSMAQGEYWSDNLDRWAEDLVDPACSGSCPGCKSRGSLPPSIVLEAMRILEGEIALREDTRIAEQAKPAIQIEEHAEHAAQLSETQDKLRVRTDDLIPRIRALPEGDELFAKELALLAKVSEVMVEAEQLLAQPNTGSESVAAETEVIELLLQSKRINPNGGGGGGSSPGGGGGGDTVDSAIALLGKGVNQQEVRVQKDVRHATGEMTSKIPEEFRAGLDEYFNRIVEPHR